MEQLESHIYAVRSWMLSHRLKINDAKTEFMILCTREQLAKVDVNNLNVGQSLIKPVYVLRNLGVTFDPQMSMSDHVNNVCRKGYHQLRKIRQIRKYLSRSATEELVHSFVTSNLDYCNALLFGAPKYVIYKLQKLQNCAARVICQAKKFDHATPLLINLHWLPVPQRIEYKIALLTYKCLNNAAPEYLCELIQLYKPSRQLRSSQKQLLNVPICITKTLGPRAFTAAAPQVWNDLPETIRNALSIKDFKCKLKTHLFQKAFYS